MRILIIRFSSMGDVVMTTPIARCLHQQLGAEIHYLTKKAYSPLLTLTYISQIHILNEEKKVDIEMLGTFNFDIIVDLQNNFRSRKACFQLSKPVLRTDKMPIRKWLFLKLRIDLLRHNPVINRHFKAIHPLEVIDDGLGLDVPMEYIEGMSMGHIAINLGGTYLTKRVPLHLGQGVVSNFPQYTFHLIGGPDVISQKISYSKYPNVIDHVGVSSLSDSIRILSQCELVITGDSGFMHIGAALQKPMITIWGSTSTLFGFAPYYGYQSDVMYHIIEELNLSCRPCSKYGVKSCPIKHMNCLNNITTAKVNSLVENVMNT